MSNDIVTFDTDALKEVLGYEDELDHIEGDLEAFDEEIEVIYGHLEEIDMRQETFNNRLDSLEFEENRLSDMLDEVEDILDDLEDYDPDDDDDDDDDEGEDPDPEPEPGLYGPPAGDLSDLAATHEQPGWGIHFTANKDFGIGETTFKAAESGTMSVELFRYEDEEALELVDSTEITVDGGVQTESLGLVGSPGEYFLTRDWGDGPTEPGIGLARDLYDGWESTSDENFEFHGGNHVRFASSDFWYYFHELEME